MYCIKCNQVFPGNCTCPDRDERFKALTGSEYLVLTHCSGCGEHVTLCKCLDPKPDIEHRTQGRILVLKEEPKNG